MQLTAKRQQLVNDAVNAGYTIKHDAEGVTIYKQNKASKKVTRGIVMFPNGTAIRADIDLELCSTIRTIKAMREQLGI